MRGAEGVGGWLIVQEPDSPGIKSVSVLVCAASQVPVSLKRPWPG